MGNNGKIYEINPDRSVDISEIVHHCTICGDINTFPTMLVAKADIIDDIIAGFSLEVLQFIHYIGELRG